MSTMSTTPNTLKNKLGTHIANAANAREALTNATTLSKAAISILLGALQTAETALQALSEIRIRAETLVQEAQSRNATTQDLKRKLADYMFHSVNVQKDHDTAINEAWNAWRSAMANIVRAGRAQSEHEDVVEELERMAEVYEGSGELEHIMSGVRTSIRKEQEEICEELNAVVEVSQDTLKGALKRINDHSKAWDSVEDAMRKAASVVRTAIADME